jgi:hypothetical protein
MQNLIQTGCSIFPSIADKTKHEVEKALTNNAYSQHGVMWQTDAIGFEKCDLGLPSSFLETVTTITVWELSNTTLYIVKRYLVILS